MKTPKILKSLSFCTLGAVVIGCSSVEDLKQEYPSVQITSEPEVMEVHADSIKISVKGQIPSGYMDKEGVIKFTPFIKHKEGKQELKRFFVKGPDAKIEKDVNVIATVNESGGGFEKSYKMPYKASYKKARMESGVDFRIEKNYDTLCQCASKENPDTLTKGTITTSLTVKPFDHIHMGGINKARSDRNRKPGERPGELQGGRSDIYNPKNNRRKPGKGVIKPEPVNHKGTIFFRINRSNILDSVKDGNTMQRVRKFARQDQLIIKTVKISSYASPDGELQRNANLTKARAESTFKYLKEELKSLGHASVEDTNFRKQAETKEDWNGFRRLVKQSDLESKGKILDIANSNMALEEKEAAIRKMPVFEDYLVPTLLPKLRRSEINIKGFMRIRPVDTLKEIAEEKGLDSLHRKELIKLAYRSNDLNRKREIYKHYTERYPDHWVGHNNLKALLLFEGRYKEALEAFKELKDRYPNKGPILNNLGVAYRHAHQYDKARKNYKAAKQKGIDERNNMGILDIKVAEYASATENFEEDRKDYNVALAHTLAGSHDKALSVIDNITTKTADVYYLKAIIGARKGDKELMTTSLRRAVEKGEGIRDRAKNDLEFRNYKDSEAFKNALRY